MAWFNGDESVSNKNLPELDIFEKKQLSIDEPETDEDTGLTILSFFHDNIEVKLHGYFKLKGTGDGLQIKGGKIKEIHAKKDGEDQWQIKNFTYKAVNFLDLLADGDKQKVVDHIYDKKDLIEGSFFNDELYGFDKDDKLVGYNGKNELHGGKGNDRLVSWNGDSEDSFVFDTKLNANSNVDSIKDYETGKDDIWLAKSIFDAFDGIAKGSEVPADNFVQGNKPLDPDDYIIYARGRGKLYYDANGSESGGKILFAKLPEHADLHHSDFLIV